MDGDEFASALRDLQPAWLVAAWAVYLAALWTRAWRWRLVLSPHLALPPRDAFALMVIGYAANNVLPVRAGELLRAGLLQRERGVAWSVGLGTIVVERIVDGLVLAVFLAGTIAVAGGSGVLRTLALAGAGAFLLAGALIALLAARGGGARALIALLAARGGGARALTAAALRLLPAVLRDRVERWGRGFRDGLTALRGWRIWTAVVALSALSWALESAMYWLTGLALGLELHPLLYLGVCGAANLAIAAPSTAGGIGPFEFFAREVAVAFGATAAVATAYALVLHVVLLAPVTVLGLILLWRREGGLRSLLRARSPTPGDA